MIDNELLIAFVVVGQNGEPVNGQILTTIVNDGGSQLASVLSIAVCCECACSNVVIASLLSSKQVMQAKHNTEVVK